MDDVLRPTVVLQCLESMMGPGGKDIMPLTLLALCEALNSKVLVFSARITGVLIAV